MGHLAQLQLTRNLTDMPYACLQMKLKSIKLKTGLTKSASHFHYWSIGLTYKLVLCNEMVSLEPQKHIGLKDRWESQFLCHHYKELDRHNNLGRYKLHLLNNMLIAAGLRHGRCLTEWVK